MTRYGGASSLAGLALLDGQAPSSLPVPSRLRVPHEAEPAILPAASRTAPGRGEQVPLTPQEAAEWEHEIGLLERCRRGDQEAYAELYDAHHAAVLRFAARRAGPGVDPEDLVHDAFAATMAAIQRGKGPIDGFRPYLFTAVRRRAISRNIEASRVVLSDRAADVVQVQVDVEAADDGAVGRAMAALPERWQLVLRLIEVEGHPVRDVAKALGLSSNATSALIYRARAGLREAYLSLLET